MFDFSVKFQFQNLDQRQHRVTAQFHGQVFSRVLGRVISNTYLQGKVQGNLRGCSTHAVQSNTLLVYAFA